MRVLTALAILLALSVLSLFVGVIDLSADAEAWSLVAVSRFPRTAAALITGASLAVAGAIMQLLARNRFVEPMTAGTGHGAALGILLVTIFSPSASLGVKMLLASSTALITSFGFLAIVRRLPVTQPILVPLVGLVYGGLIGAGVTFVAFQSDLLQYIEIWMSGELSGILQGRYELLWIAAIVAVASYLVADQFAILGMGKSVSLNLGLNYDLIVLLGLLVVSVVTALTVVVVGMITFVGLVVPNIVSRLMGDDLRSTLPTIAALGAGLVLACDIAGRLVRYPFEIPVGTILGVIGTFVFLWLLFAKPRHAA